MNNDENESLHKFPCDFTFKIFGNNSEKFEDEVLRIFKQHVPDFSSERLIHKQSSQGKYQSISVTIHAQSKAELDRIYQDLSKSPLVLMVL